jgi:molybdopterin synthase catalytic subunit
MDKSTMQNSFTLTHEVLSETAVRNALSHDACGAIVLFVGTVRDRARGADVLYLEFEAYESMVYSVLEDITHELQTNFGIRAVALHHRLGRVEVGEAAVIAGISAPHRAEAFAACEALMSRLKESVPIWKKEFTTDGAVWVSSTP